MAWSYTDAATVGKPDSPMGAAKKAGLIGRPAIAGESGLFDGSAIMDALGYGKNAGGINIAEPGGSPGNRVQPIAANTLATPTPPQRTPLGAPEQIANKALNGAGVKPVSQQTPMQNTPSAPPAIAGGIKKTVGKFGETKFSDGSGGFVMNEQNRLAEVARQNTAEESQALKIANENMIKQANDIDPIFGMAAAASVAKNNTSKYAADQALAGHKLTADAHTKAAEIAGGAAVQKAQLDARVKVGEQKQMDTTALQQKVYDQIMKGYDYTGISPTAVHDYATTMAKTAGKGYVTIADPTGTHGDAVVHPGVAAFANQYLKSVKTPDQYVRLLQELDKVAAGGVHRTGIKSTQQLKSLKVSPNQIAGMTTEQG